MSRKSNPAGLLPLTPRVLLILWALSDGPLHGYRLLKLAEERGRGLVPIGPTSLYESIATLRERGLIEHTKSPAKADRKDARRRYFRLTKQGRDVLRAEASRLASLADDLRDAGLAEAARNP